MDVTASPPAPAILVDHSMGGVVALRRAALEPVPVAGLILSDTFLPPALNGRGRAATLADYVSHRAALAREPAARGSAPRPRRGTALGMGSLARPRAGRLRARGRHPPPSWSVRVVEQGSHNVHVERPAEWLAAAGGWLDDLAG